VVSPKLKPALKAATFASRMACCLANFCSIHLSVSSNGGFLPRTLTLDTVIDEHFLEHALIELGPYRPPEAR